MPFTTLDPTSTTAMKLANFFVSLLLSTFALANQIQSPDGANEEGLGYVNFDISYEIIERPEAKPAQPIEFTAAETATFNITFQNHEDQNVTIVGLAGSVIDATAGQESANITAQELGPFAVPINGSVNFQTAIQLTLPEGSFYLAPLLFVVKEEELMKVGIPPLSIFVSPPSMSFFNPKFLSVPLLIALVVIGGTYAMANSKSLGGKRETVARRGIKSKTADDGWLPDIHKK